MPCAIVLLPCIVIRSTSVPWRQHVCAWFPDAVRCRVLLSSRFIRAVDMHDRLLLPIGLGLADAMPCWILVRIWCVDPCFMRHRELLHQRRPVISLGLRAVYRVWSRQL